MERIVFSKNVLSLTQNDSSQKIPYEQQIDIHQVIKIDR